MVVRAFEQSGRGEPRSRLSGRSELPPRQEDLIKLMGEDVDWPRIDLRPPDSTNWITTLSGARDCCTVSCQIDLA